MAHPRKRLLPLRWRSSVGKQIDSRRLGIEGLEQRTMLTAELGFAVGIGSSGVDIVRDLVVDAGGNAYVTGYFAGNVDFDPGPGDASLTAAGANDGFVAKYDSAGALVWARRFGGAGDDRGHGIAVDGNDNVLVTGRFTGTVDFDPGPGVNNLVSAGNLDGYNLKLNSAGNLVWASRFGGSGVDLGHDIAVDSAGDVYTIGTHQGTVDFDSGPGNSNTSANGGGFNDVFVSKLDGAGDFQWAGSVGTSGDDHGNSIAIGPTGDVYAAFDFNGFLGAGNSVDFDPGPGVSNVSSYGSYDVGILRLTSSGSFVWGRAIGSSGQDGPNEIAVDSAGGVYTTGGFVGTVDFDPSPGVATLSSVGQVDAFVSKLDASGDFVWARRLGSTGVEHGTGIAVDAADNVWITGSFDDTIDFDPGAGAFNLTSQGVRDIFVWQLNSSGSFLQAVSAGGTGEDSASSVAVDLFGNVLVSGHFTNTVDFDPGPGIANVTSAGSVDGFVWKLTQNQPPVASDDHYEINEDGDLVVHATEGVLGNDTDADMDSLVVSQVISGPNHGSLTVSADGALTYRPEADFNGSDSFTYEITDGNGGFAMATVTIDVLSVQQQIDRVFDDVEGLVFSGTLNNGQGSSLATKIDTASEKLEAGKIHSGINQLEALINQIEDFISGGILDDDEGESLIEQIARAIVSAG